MLLSMRAVKEAVSHRKTLHAANSGVQVHCSPAVQFTLFYWRVNMLTLNFSAGFVPDYNISWFMTEALKLKIYMDFSPNTVFQFLERMWIAQTHPLLESCTNNNHIDSYPKHYIHNPRLINHLLNNISTTVTDKFNVCAMKLSCTR